MVLSVDCCSSVVLLEMLAGVGFVGVSSVASAAAVSVRVRSLCRDMEDTWRGRGSKKGLVVILLIGGNGSNGGELFRAS